MGQQLPCQERILDLRVESACPLDHPGGQNAFVIRETLLKEFHLQLYLVILANLAWELENDGFQKESPNVSS